MGLRWRFQPTAASAAHPIKALSKNNLQLFNRGKIMCRLEKFFALIILLTTAILLTNCGGVSSGKSGNSGSTSSGSGSGSGGSGGAQNIPGYGEGIGASGQTGAPKFLYANPLPGGGPYAASIGNNGTLTLTTGGSANNVDPETLAIDPSGSFIFQTAVGFNGGTQGGIFVYAINRSNGSPGKATGSYLTGQTLYADVVDNKGKFLYALSTNGVYAFSIQPGSGILTPVPGSPFAAAGASSAGYPQPATLMTVDQTNQFLYVSTSAGISGYTIDQSSGALSAIAGSPFGAEVIKPWTIVVTPNNSYLYELQSQDDKNIYAYSINQSSGVLTPISGSPFSTGTCGTVVTPGTVGIPGPDNMTIASAGKFMYDNCGIYSIDESTGTISQVSNSGPGDWPVISPAGDFLWAITGDQEACFNCDIGITTYQVDANNGALTAVPNSFVLLTNSEVGSVDSLAITK
jgi:6-phosphogluconolactonase (cycloisomerase 2 family)